MSTGGSAPTYTLVSFHAHPDDEALLVAGTLAKAAADGHRVVLVVATAGEQGLADDAVLGDDDLAERRRDELRRSAEAIGCHRVVLLEYADSGLDGRQGGAGAFCAVSLDDAAARLAEVLVDEKADVLTIYDPNGGYGHPDHVRVHAVGRRAAQLAGTPVVLEATIDRRPLCRVVALLRPFGRFLRGLDLPDFSHAYSPTSRITHRIDVRAQLGAKRKALSAHGTQGTADAGLRTIGLLLRLPGPVFGRALGHEWFVEQGRRPGGPLATDVFDTLRRRDLIDAR